ncbi:methylmalonyl-CoA epimerase [Alkalicoccus chagannorensis]|uniref:methylmalonyl-CoA epimerase n=1 Tax=Alkalicoccus chagannorensis TaxID=427072 RepID=UPI0004149BA6|nr:methylmalonyl-CoA epimerase [Alkalicoccus chagannorensis]
MSAIRVLIAKPGLDGHDRGALVISQALRDAGMEVIYTGLRQSPAQIVRAAVQEDVDVIGLSSLSGAHNVLFPEVMKELEKAEASDMLVIGGGVIPVQDIQRLEEEGIAKIFTPGTPTADIVHYIERKIAGETVVKEAAAVDHIGIAAYSIEETADFYRTHFGLRVEQVVEVPEQGVRVAFLPAVNVTLEVLEPLGENSPVQRFLDKRGPGLHHLAFQTTGIKDRIQELKTRGVQMLDEEPKPGAKGHPIAFLHPSAASGTLVELTEADQHGHV